MFLTSHENFARRNVTMTARGVLEVVLKRPFYVLIKSVSKQAVTFRKGMRVARWAGFPQQLVELQLEEQKMPGQAAGLESANAIHYRQQVCREA